MDLQERRNAFALAKSIFLIGPMGTGKSTVGSKLAKILPDIRMIKVDEHRGHFFRNNPAFSREQEAAIREEQRI